jgi:subtilisin family serine protease
MIDIGSRYCARNVTVAGFRSLCWRESWEGAEGQGVAAGLLDTRIDEAAPDLAGANLTIRNFTSGYRLAEQRRDHGTHSAAMLVGQGRARVRGLVPGARLLVAEVVESDGVATPEAVAAALDWLREAGARIVALPLGDSADRADVGERLTRGHAAGAVYFAAAGNRHPDPLAFPARHPLAIAVGATDGRGALLQECCRRPRLDLTAPGFEIASAVRGRMVRRRSGSSVACVLAAGVAALAISSGALAGHASREGILDLISGGGGRRASTRSVTGAPKKHREKGPNNG